MILGYVLVARDRSEAASIVGTVVAVVGAGAAVADRFWFWSTRRDETAGDSWRDAEADALARAVSLQWSHEASLRGILAPSPVKICWRLSIRAADGEPGAAAFDPPGGVAPTPIPGIRRTVAADLARGGVVNDLHDLYAGLPSGRLVVIGDAGTGKTSAAILLLLAALRHRESLPEPERRQVPVPVIVTLAGWNPARATLLAFAATSLARDYPFLRRSADGSDIATRLVEHGSVALFLDGLDEMPAHVRTAAVKAIDRHLTSRIVLTTRPYEYDESTRRARLYRAVAIELLPVDGTAASNYLLLDRPRHTSAAWERIADHLVADGSSPLAQALNTPLMLTLVSDAYTAGKDPAELLDVGSFPTTTSIQDHLLDQVLPSSYTSDRRAGGYSLSQAQRWLSYIAYGMLREDSRDVVWSQISGWVPIWLSRIAYGALFGLIIFCAAWLGVAASPLVGDGCFAPAAWGVAGAGAYIVGASLDYRVSGMPVVALVLGIATGVWIGMLGGLAFGLLLVPWAGVTLGLSLGLVTGSAVGVAIGLVLVWLGMKNVRVAARRSWPATLGIGSIAPSTIALILAFSLAFVLLASPRSQLVAILAAVFGVSVGLIGDVVMSAQSSDSDAPTPRVSLRYDIIAWSVLGLVIGIAGAFIFGFAFQTGFASSFAWIGLGLAIALAASHASGYTFAVMVMAVTRRGPVRLLRFLEDARRRQILRRVGWVYQFRHARLQDRLAEHYQRRQR
jgi:hypothetical protein